MTKRILLLFLFTFLVACSCTKQGKLNHAPIISVETLGVGSLDNNCCTINGRIRILLDDNLKAKRVWFYYAKGKMSLPDLISSGIRVDTEIDYNQDLSGLCGISYSRHDRFFEATISDVEKDTQYCFVAGAEVKGKKYFGEVITFLHPSCPGTPVFF